jgi:hypothetical protein
MSFLWFELIGFVYQGSLICRAGTHRNAVPVPFETTGTPFRSRAVTHKEFPFVLCFSLQIIWQILFAWHCMSCIVPVGDYLYFVDETWKCPSLAHPNMK